MERIEWLLADCCVNCDWKENDNGTWYGIIEFWTDTAGQDIPTEFTFDGTAEDFVKEFTEAAKRYDVDEEVELYAGMRGKQGVPNTIRELMDDCREAKDTLMKLAEKLNWVIAPIETKEIEIDGYGIETIGKDSEQDKAIISREDEKVFFYVPDDVFEDSDDNIKGYVEKEI